jgi:threonylcarbamoyladenosine tRNA methylthiotransferase MtaB
MAGPRVAFHTLGCKVNQYDSAGMEQLFLERGYQVVGFDEVAEVYVINSCAVTGRSEAKSRQAARRAARQNPGAVVALVGCYPQVDARAAELAGVQVVSGVQDRHRIVDLVEAAGHPSGTGRAAPAGPESCDFPAPHFAGRSRALLKIQDGCDGACTYCIVPAARGKARSRHPESVLREARRLLDAGYREIVLTGIRLGAYGREWGDTSLAGIVGQLGELGGYRLRLSSLEPEDVTGRLLEVLAGSPVVCPHLHLPLQSGSDRILDAMGRRYRAEGFCRLVEEVRGVWPGAAITTDVIVGFPGEGAAEYLETLALVERLAFSRLHVFKYSPRPKTRARDFPDQVPDTVKAVRSLELTRLGRRLARKFHSSFVGRHVEVLVEAQPEPGRLQGLTGHYVRARFAGSSRWCHRLVMVRVTGADPAGVEGELVGRDE